MTALVLDGLLVTLPAGRVHDVARRALVGQVANDGLTPLVLARIGGRACAIAAELKEVVATDLRTGEVVWRAGIRWAGGLAAIELGGRAVVVMNRVAKYGDGARHVLDAATGREIDAGVLGEGRVFADVDAPSHHAILDGDALAIRRASDGATVNVVAWDARAPGGETRVDPVTGARVTTQAFDFGPQIERVWFGPDEVVVVTSTRIVVVGHDGVMRVHLERGDVSVFWVAWHAGVRTALVRRADQRVDAVRIDATGLAVVAADCDGVAIVGGELVTAGLQIGRVGGPVTASLPLAQAAVRTAREPGPIAVDAAIVALLAKLRCVARETGPLGLSVAALAPAEAALGRELPSWVLAVLALRSATLGRRWSVDVAGFAGLATELADCARESREPVPSGVVAIGKTVVTKKVKSRSSYGYRATWRTYWCARDAEAFLVERLENHPFSRDGEIDPSQPMTFTTSVSGPHAPSHVLAAVLDALRETNAKKLGGAAHLATLETAAVAALPSLSLIP